MRFTRAWLFTVLAIAVPIGLMLVPLQSAPASAEGQETSVGEAVLLILTQWSFIGFSIAALISTRPAGRWGKASATLHSTLPLWYSGSSAWPQSSAY